MRLFLGFAPTPAEREVYSVCEAFSPAEELPLRWVPPENWHVTLVFLGEVAESSLPRLDATVAEVTAVHGPQSLTVNAIEWFPSPLKPRLLTLAVEPAESLMAMQADLSAALRREGFHSEQRGYRPHLTLARLKGARKHFTPPALLPIAPFQIEPAEVLLFESTRRPKGSEYRSLQRYELAA